MHGKNKIVFHFMYFLSISAVIGISSFVVWEKIQPTKKIENQTVLGKTSEIVPTQTAKPIQTHFNTVVSPIYDTVTITPTHIAPSPIKYEITIESSPNQLTQGDTATFTWYIQGVPNVIKSTAVYFGTTNEPETFSTNVSPKETKYTDSTKDFSDGSYRIPLRFIGNTPAQKPGIYYYRVYARINEKHYWSDERSFIVTQAPKHEIKIVDPPANIHSGENITFTWDIYGPSSTSWYSVIASGKQSKSEDLDANINLSMTPYAILVNEFITGPYTVPLRFIGNAKIIDPGVYYFRALSYINGKNIWSPEYSFSVE